MKKMTLREYLHGLIEDYYYDVGVELCAYHLSGMKLSDTVSVWTLDQDDYDWEKTDEDPDAPGEIDDQDIISGQGWEIVQHLPDNAVAYLSLYLNRELMTEVEYGERGCAATITYRNDKPPRSVTTLDPNRGDP